jgi:hypothetical protein
MNGRTAKLIRKYVYSKEGGRASPRVHRYAKRQWQAISRTEKPRVRQHMERVILAADKLEGTGDNG